ncbi:MAG: CDP-glycerol glycerophosphotransferase family protein, partial [Lactobacillus sp.]|nr:CDP-glycerol glycerophosphotransferase family protein [Lactobacillus sp.]
HDIQVNQLVENADILLTDYSSVFYEFLLLDRPIGFLIGDMNEYARGFIMEHPLDEMPGEKIRNYEELLTFIDRSNSTPDDYSKQRSVVCNKVFTYKDNKNCERFFNWIQQQNKGIEE